MCPEDKRNNIYNEQGCVIPRNEKRRVGKGKRKKENNQEGNKESNDDNIWSGLDKPAVAELPPSSNAIRTGRNMKAGKTRGIYETPPTRDARNTFKWAFHDASRCRYAMTQRPIEMR
uniref:Uncharacterized protein n=1 Tax=Trypanosoma congolense (strain IL3000) TaxID=1068625 RepID=G0UR70_TRYCI|nr:hypothetical protein, unlikely [Trypanosoma congolense IL3000]